MALLTIVWEDQPLLHLQLCFVIWDHGRCYMGQSVCSVAHTMLHISGSSCVFELLFQHGLGFFCAERRGLVDITCSLMLLGVPDLEAWKGLPLALFSGVRRTIA
jgi:hypothetical protein